PSQPFGNYPVFQSHIRPICADSDGHRSPRANQASDVLPEQHARESLETQEPSFTPARQGAFNPAQARTPEGFSRTCVLSWRAWRGLASPKELTRIPIENKALSTGSSLPESTSPPDWPPLLGEKQNGSRIGHPRHAKARQQDRLKKNKIAWLSPSFQHWPFLVTAPPNFLPSCFQLLARNATRIRSSLPITSKWKPGHTRPLNTNMKNTNQPRTPTEAQINANRQNAKKSTGPKPAEGKAASSRNRRRNRLLHGLRANKHILLDEDPAEFLFLFLFLLHDHLDRFHPVGRRKTGPAHRLRSMAPRPRPPHGSRHLPRPLPRCRRKGRVPPAAVHHQKGYAEQDGEPVPPPPPGPRL